MRRSPGGRTPTRRLTRSAVLTRNPDRHQLRPARQVQVRHAHPLAMYFHSGFGGEKGPSAATSNDSRTAGSPHSA